MYRDKIIQVTPVLGHIRVCALPIVLLGSVSHITKLEVWHHDSDSAESDSKLFKFSPLTSESFLPVKQIRVQSNMLKQKNLKILKFCIQTS